MNVILLNQLNWALSQVLALTLKIMHHKPLKLYILEGCLIDTIFITNKSIVHPPQWYGLWEAKTLSIEKVGTLAQLLPKASMRSSNRTTLRHAIKNLAFRNSTCLPLSRWICQLVLWGISMWIFEHKQAKSPSFKGCPASLFKCSYSKFCPLYHQSGQQGSL